MDHVKMSLNPFCEIALEQGLQLRDAGLVSEVLAVSVGSKHATDALKSALGMGADAGIHVKCTPEEEKNLEPLLVARALSRVVRSEGTPLVLLGKQSIDNDYNQTGQMLAGLLGWPQATFASQIELDGETLRVRREVDDGMETVKISLPAVVTADLRLNRPRYATLPNILKAKKKPVQTLDFREMADHQEPQLEVLRVVEPPPRRAGTMVGSVEELLDRLRNEAKVL